MLFTQAWAPLQSWQAEEVEFNNLLDRRHIADLSDVTNTGRSTWTRPRPH